jgi:hypothetical protein
VGKLADTSTGTRVVTDGRMLRFDATGVSAKLHRLRGNRERVATRRERYARLLDGPVDSKLDNQLALLQAKERSWPPNTIGSVTGFAVLTAPSPGRLPAGRSTKPKRWRRR